MPDARCTRGPVRKSSRLRARAYRAAEAIRHSLRNGFTAYIVLSPATNSSCHRRRRIKVCLSPVGPTRLRRLDASNGRQDHTVLPYAAPVVANRLRPKGLRRVKLASPGFVVRLHVVNRSRAKARPAIPFHADAAASTASCPTFVTTMIRPSCWDRMDESLAVICPTTEAEYF